MSVASKLITIAENLQAKLDAINAKLTAKGQTEAANFDEIPAKVEAIETGSDVSGVTATADDVLVGKQFVDSTGMLIDGSMADNGTVTQTLDTSITSYTIPAGKHSGSGSVSITTQTKSTTPSTSSQTISADTGKVLKSVTVGAMSAGALSTPSISVSSSGVITATSGISTAGYLSTSTSKSNTKSLTTQSGTTITPGTSTKTAVSSGRYTTGTVYVSGDSNLVSSNIKSGVSIFGVSGSYSGGSGGIGACYSATPSSTTNLQFTDIGSIDNIVGFYIYSGSVPMDSFYICNIFIVLSSPGQADNSSDRRIYSFPADGPGKVKTYEDTNDDTLGHLLMSGSLSLISNNSAYPFYTSATYYCYPIYGA